MTVRSHAAPAVAALLLVVGLVAYAGSAQADDPGAAIAYASDDPQAGNAYPGDELTATGAAATDVWCYQDADGNNTPIPGATGSSYTVTPADADNGALITICSTADYYSTDVASVNDDATTDVVTVDPLAFALDGSITIYDGNTNLDNGADAAVVGDTLKAKVDLGSDDGITGLTTTGQWVETDASGDTTALSGGTGSSLRIPSGFDLTQALSYQVTLDASGYDSSDAQLASNPIAIFTITGNRAVVTGTPRVGQQLAAAAPIVVPDPDKTAYQWFRNGVKIHGATTATYTLKAADVGKTISCTVTVTENGSAWKTFPSNATGKVTKASATDVVSATPTISGTARVGKVLRVKPGAWKPAGLALTFQWYANGKKISGATKRSLTLVKSLAGKRITVVVRGAKTGFSSATATSAPTKLVAKK